MQRTAEVEQALQQDPYVAMPCRRDRLSIDFLDKDVPGGRNELGILDWEYGGMGDFFFDLADFSHHHRLSDHQVLLLLHEYSSEVKPKVFARLKLMWPMSEIHEAM